MRNCVFSQDFHKSSIFNRKQKFTRKQETVRDVGEVWNGTVNMRDKWFHERRRAPTISGKRWMRPPFQLHSSKFDYSDRLRNQITRKTEWCSNFGLHQRGRIIAIRLARCISATAERFSITFTICHYFCISECAVLIIIIKSALKSSSMIHEWNTFQNVGCSEKLLFSIL